ncbi:MAG TPA: hypothetical protein VIK89_00295 [Cytophagaceae bacterium]
MESPELVVPFDNKLIPVIQHKHTKSRWEAMYAISLIVPFYPEMIEAILPELNEIIEKDQSTIVRDRATEALAAYASINKDTAKKAFPYLKKVIDVWQDKHANRALEGMHNAFLQLPFLKKNIQPIAEIYSESSKGVVKKAANKLLKALQ